MQKENVKKYAILMAITGILLMMTGVGYALFTYFGLGSTTISISSNGVIFSYNEGKQGISLTESMPLTDIEGMAQSEYFEFNIKAQSVDKMEIPYYITARKTSNSSDIDEAIKLYLTKVDKNGNEEDVALVKFSDLKQYTNSGIDLSKYVEKILYNTRVVSNQVNYHQTYRLRMWIDYDTDFTNTKYQNANFGLTINVYGTAKNSDIYAKANGRLHVTGSKLMNQNNEEFRLMGASNGIAPQAQNAVLKPGNKMYTKKSLSNLKNWGANGFRIFCGETFWDSTTEEYSKGMIDLKQTIDNLIDLDMYVILNWNPGGNMSIAPPTSSAITFFNDISSYYGNDSHILYEIWNEPSTGVSWSRIKEHANQVIPVIRANSPDSVILVGTPEYDKRVDLVINDQLNFDNIMYTIHMYAQGVTYDSLNYIDQAIKAGVPVFMTECASAEAGTIREDKIEPAHSYTLAKLLEKYNLSYMVFCYESGYWNYNFVGVKENDWDENLPDSILRENAKWFKRILKNDYSTSSYLMIENSDDIGKYYRSDEWKDKIVSVKFKNKLVVPNNAVITWDLSLVQDESIMGYLMPSQEEDTYDLVICANGYINLPVNSRNIFRDLSNVKSYDFTYVKTDLVQNLSSAFRGNASVEELDLSTFNTNNLTLMYSTFAGNKKLKSINFTNWHPNLSSGITMLFSDCESLEELDLSGFNVDNVSVFQGAFYRNNKLRTLNISTWTPKQVKDLSIAFWGVNSLTELDLTGFKTFSDDCNYSNIFRYITNNSLVIKTGNEIFKNNMISMYPDLNIQ